MKTTVQVLLAIILSGLAGLAGAEAKSGAACLPLRARNSDGNYIVPGVRGEIVYRVVGRRGLAMDAYVQRRGGVRPGVVVVHGGGWDSGSRVSFVGQFLEMLTGAGYNWFSIDYRLGDREAATQDLLSAIEFIRCHNAELRTDPSRMAILAEDTGAQMALEAAALNPQSAGTLALIGGRYDPLALPDRLDAVKALIVHGSADREAPLQTAADVCGRIGQCRLVEVPDGIHRAENWRPEQWGYKRELLAWLRGKLKPGKSVHLPYASSKLRKEIVYDSDKGLRLDAYTPAGAGPHPAVIIAHGGGWEAGDRVTYVAPLFEPLARAGFAWFSIDYSLTPKYRHQDQLDDLKAAIAFVRQHAARFRIDPRRIAILGESASGQMVAQAASEGWPGIEAVVSFYGVYDFVSRAGEITPRSIPTRLFGITRMDDEAARTLRRYSPLYNVSKHMPPLLLICGSKDGLYSQHTAYIEKLRGAGADFQEFTVDGAPHGVENWEGHDEWMGYKKALTDWLREKLKK